MTNHPFNLSVQNPPWCLISRRHLNSRLWVDILIFLDPAWRWHQPRPMICEYFSIRYGCVNTTSGIFIWILVNIHDLFFIFTNICGIICGELIFSMDIGEYPWWISMIYWMFMINSPHVAPFLLMGCAAGSPAVTPSPGVGNSAATSDADAAPAKARSVTKIYKVVT